MVLNEKKKTILKHTLLIVNIVLLIGLIILCFIRNYVSVNLAVFNHDPGEIRSETITIADIVFGGRITSLERTKLSFSPIPTISFFLLVTNLFFVYFFFLKLWIRLIVTLSISVINLVSFSNTIFLIKYDSQYISKSFITIGSIYYIIISFLIVLITGNSIVLSIWYFIKRKEKKFSLKDL